jgi:hypothetical protein
MPDTTLLLNTSQKSLHLWRQKFASNSCKKCIPNPFLKNALKINTMFAKRANMQPGAVPVQLELSLLL